MSSDFLKDKGSGCTYIHEGVQDAPPFMVSEDKVLQRYRTQNVKPKLHRIRQFHGSSIRGKCRANLFY
jgi:hypothetical protein